MHSLWVVWLLAFLISFAALETYAFATNQITLSAYMFDLGQRWPIVLVLYGAVFGALAAHFWWRWSETM
jgi:hypothetical protein